MIITILTIVALWKLYTKAGEAGWKCLIPIYNIYIMFQIARNDGFVKMIILAIVEGVCFVLGTGLMVAGAMGSVLAVIIGAIAFIAGIVAGVYMLVIEFRMYVDLAQAFGHKRNFAWGLLLLTPVFIWIIGLGEDTYSVNFYAGNVNGVQNMMGAQQNGQTNYGAYMPPQYPDNQQNKEF